MQTFLSYKKQIGYGAIGVIALCVVIKILTVVYLAGLPPEDGRVYEATVQAELLELSVKTKVWCGVLILFPVTVLVLTIAHTAITLRIRVKLASVHPFEVCGSKILVHERDLQIAAPIAMGIVNGEQLKQANAGLETALHLAGQIQTWQERQMKLLNTPVAAPALMAAAEPDSIETPVVMPTFSDLLHTRLIAPGQPLIMGIAADGTPQPRRADHIKAMAIAGWQGSGKTLSSAYLVTCILYQYQDALVYVIDPHRQHDESLTALIAPLAACGRLHLVNPVDTANTLTRIFTLLDARLDGVSPSTPPVFLVIDEMARLAKSLSDEDFDTFIEFLERATEETRKANITFIGISQKWDARNFKNRKDIRASMPSLLVHKCKPSQAELLLEDSQERKLVKALKQPGECLLATSHDADPQVVTMPFITTRDIQRMVRLIGNGVPMALNVESGVEPVDLPNSTVLNGVDQAVTEMPILAQISALKVKRNWSLGELAHRANVDKGLLSKVLNGKEELTPGVKRNLETLLTTEGQQSSTAKIIRFDERTKR